MLLYERSLTAPPTGLPKPSLLITDFHFQSVPCPFFIHEFPFQRCLDKRSMWESLQRIQETTERLTAPATVCLCSPWQATTPFEFLSDPPWRHRLARLGPSAGYYQNLFTSWKTIFYMVNLLWSGCWTETDDVAIKNREITLDLKRKARENKYHLFSIIVTRFQLQHFGRPNLVFNPPYVKKWLHAGQCFRFILTVFVKSVQL